MQHGLWQLAPMGSQLYRDIELSWRFNEHGAASLHDWSRKSRNGVITGGTWTGGKNGSAVSLDGTDDMITASRVPITGDWSAIVHYTPDTVSGRHPILDQGDILIYQNDNDIIFGMADDAYTDHTGTVTACLAAGVPVTIAVTLYGTALVAYVYSDTIPGYWTGTATASGTPLTALTNLIIGSDSRTAFIYPALTPANLTSEKAIVINASDDLQYSVGSASLNSDVVAENWNGIQETTLVWIDSLNFVPGDGLTHYILDNQGTGASQNRTSLYIDSAGLLTFVLFDNDSTQHLVSFDITGWTVGSAHQIAARYDLNADEIELYTDGVSRDATPDNALSADTIGAIESTTQIGADTSQANQLNGSMAILIENRSWSDAEVTAVYDSGAGTPFVVSPDTILLDNFTDGVTTISYHHTGKGVSAISNGGTESTLTTAAGSDTAFADNDTVVVSDGKGYSKAGFVDGTPSDTSVDVDDGAGALVADIEKVGVALDLDGTYYAQAANNTVHDIGLQDIGIAAWVKVNSDATANSFIMRKLSGNTYYALYCNATGANGAIQGYMVDGTDGYFVYGNTDIRDGVWHHIAIIFDRDNAANCKIYLDGEEDGSTNKNGTLGDIDTLTNTGILHVGSRENGLSPVDGEIRDVVLAYPADIMAANEMGAAGEILYMATHPLDVANYPNFEDHWPCTEGAGTTLTGVNNDLTLTNAAAWTQNAHLSRNLLVDGSMENGGIGAWTIVATPTLVDKESDTDSDSLSLHIVSAADDDGVSQTIPASNGDKFYLAQRHKVTAGSFEVNVTNGGGGIETGIADANWTLLEKIISATGNLTFQWLGEAAADDFNISKAGIFKCVAGNALDATTYYTLVNVDGGAVGAAWSGLGADAPETDAADLYIRNDTRTASTATRTRDFADGKVEDLAVWSRGLSEAEIAQWRLMKEV